MREEVQSYLPDLLSRCKEFEQALCVALDIVRGDVLVKTETEKVLR